MINTFWKNKKGKEVCIQSIPDRHLNNIRKMFTVDNGRDKIEDIMNEIKRRKMKRKAS